MPRSSSLPVVAALVASGALGCGSPDPWDQPPRFVVLPFEGSQVYASLEVGVAWIPAGEGGTAHVTDVVHVPALSLDFDWEPEGPPPPNAMRKCEDPDCDEAETAAVGWLLVFEDQDPDGAATVLVPEDAGRAPADLVAEGADRLVGIATDHVVAYAPSALAKDGELAQTLGWPLVEGVSVMGVRHEDGKDLLVPTVSRERVPLYLLARDEREGEPEEGGLCCEQADCDHEGVRCPTFQGQGDQVD